MMDRKNPNENPKNWTTQYMRTHRGECLLLLREVNQEAVRCMEERRCWAAIECIDLLLDGFDALQKSERSDRIRSCIADYAYTAAELCALADPAGFEHELRSRGIRPDLRGKSTERYLRDTAIKGLNNAKSSGSGELRERAASMARALKSDIPAERLRWEYAPNFPRDLQERLLRLDDDFFAPALMQCAPEPCAVLDRNRLTLKQETVELAPALVPAPAPASFSPAQAPPDRSPDRADMGEDSYFDGNTLQLIGYGLLSFLVCAVTLGIAFPWMLCMQQRWEAKHTVIHGRRLSFDGRGIQLLGRYLLWVLLTLITFGIYGIWLGLRVKQWTVKHTFYADSGQSAESYFSGGVGGFLGIHILAFLLTVFTLGIGAAWAKTMILRWEAGHTHIEGVPLEFNGTGGQLLVKYLLLVILTPLTLGIYTLFFPVSYMKWQVRHTDVSGGAADRVRQPAPAGTAPMQAQGGKKTPGPALAAAAVALAGVLIVLIFTAAIISFRSVVAPARPFGAIFAPDPEQEASPAAPENVLTDQELMELAEQRLNSGVEICIANAGFVEVDTSDYITVENEWGDSSTFSRVIGYDTFAEAEQAAAELWYSVYARGTAFDEIGYLSFQLMEVNGKLYKRDDGGLGDGGFYWVVEHVVSRTDDEAVFAARSSWDYEDDSSDTLVQFSMVLEDGDWKLLRDWE